MIKNKLALGVAAAVVTGAVGLATLGSAHALTVSVPGGGNGYGNTTVNANVNLNLENSNNNVFNIVINWVFGS